MSAIGTLGSILGTFVSGFYLIPYFGMNTLLAVLPLILIFLSLLIAPRHLTLIKIIGSIVLIGIFVSLDRAYAEP